MRSIIGCDWEFGAWMYTFFIFLPSHFTCMCHTFLLFSWLRKGVVDFHDSNEWNVRTIPAVPSYR